MNQSEIEILISSDMSYEHLTVEMMYKGKFIALLSQEDGIDKLKIEFPGKDVDEDLVLRKIDLNIFEKALALAKKRICE